MLGIQSPSSFNGPSKSSPLVQLPLFNSPQDLKTHLNKVANFDKEFTRRVDQHVAILREIAKKPDVASYQGVIKSHYQDYSFLGAAVSKKLSQDERNALFGDANPIQHVGCVNLSDPSLYRVTDAHRQSLGILTPSQTVKQLSPKEAYIHGIATTAMLGESVLEPLANMICRTIVVVRAEASGNQGENNVELIVSPNGSEVDLQGAIFVQNSNNVHFRTFNPAPHQTVLKGCSLAGNAVEGDYKIGAAGFNDCLIASLRGGGADFQDLTNQSIRQTLAQWVRTNAPEEAFIQESDKAVPAVQFNTITSIPDGYVGLVVVKPNEDNYAIGHYNAGPVGVWQALTTDGKFEVVFNDGHQMEKCHQLGQVGDDGKIQLLREPKSIQQQLSIFDR